MPAASNGGEDRLAHTGSAVTRPVASAAGRLDVIQVRLEDGLAVPLFGLSALLSILTAADGYVVVPEEATGLGSGTGVDVTLYR